MNMLDSPIFELSPIAMWLEDFSEVKKQFDLWRAQGVQDLLTFFARRRITYFRMCEKN